MLEEIPKPMFSFKADTLTQSQDHIGYHWFMIHDSHSSQNLTRKREFRAQLKLGACVERSSPKRRCSLFLSSIS